uniref:STAR protein homodimerisation region domain-containing protein n=1 Tax=Lates calcarifer TaxID=8187 RepID=A0A4W6FF23_LATCA
MTMVGERWRGKEKPRPSPDYLMQLMNDKKLMSSLPNFCGIFQHLERLLDEGETRTTCLSVCAPVCLSEV